MMGKPRVFFCDIPGPRCASEQREERLHGLLTHHTSAPRPDFQGNCFRAVPAPWWPVVWLQQPGAMPALVLGSSSCHDMHGCILLKQICFKACCSLPGQPASTMYIACFHFFARLHFGCSCGYRNVLGQQRARGLVRMGMMRHLGNQLGGHREPNTLGMPGQGLQSTSHASAMWTLKLEWLQGGSICCTAGEVECGLAGNMLPVHISIAVFLPASHECTCKMVHKHAVGLTIKVSCQLHTEPEALLSHAGIDRVLKSG